MTKAVTTIPDTAWISFQYPQAVFDEEQQRWISDAQVTGRSHLINSAGSAGGGRLLTPRRMATIMDATITALDRRLARETPASLELTLQFPTRWDPYFRDTTTVLDVYHYGTEHYDHHRHQLTLAPPPTRRNLSRPSPCIWYLGTGLPSWT